MKVQSDKYKHICYSTFIGRTEPAVGLLSHVILTPMATVQCNINIKGIVLDNYDNITITVALKQVSTKTKRTKRALANPDKSNVFYRANLDTLISNYFVPTEYFEYSKPLLLNDLISDKNTGDTAIQVLFHFGKADGTNDFFLCPGSPRDELSMTIGLSIFEANSIEEVLDSIILTMSNLLVDNVLPSYNIDTSNNILDDIRRYLHFHFYGD